MTEAAHGDAVHVSWEVHMSRGDASDGCIVSCGRTEEWCGASLSQEWVTQVGCGVGGVEEDGGGVETSGRWSV